MDNRYLERLDAGKFPSPCFIVDEERLLANMHTLNLVQERTGAKVLMALKAFAMWGLFPLLSKAHNGLLHGTCASSPHEARLGRECFGGEVHAFAAAYSEQDIEELCAVADHILFNSFAQWQRFKPFIQQAGRSIECGIRVNPEHSEGAVDLYNPCSAGSRLGVRRRHFQPELLDGISGLHFHTLCEQNSDALERTLDAFLEKFGEFLPQMRWVNFGGGHHITRSDYDIDRLCRCIEKVKKAYNLEVYLEPGEAAALNAGILSCTVLDIIEADMPIAIIDSSATAHMPDTLEMPYCPHIIGSGLLNEKKYSYRIAGKSCLAGDVVNEYSFDAPLQVGQHLAFTDMAHYTMVKTTTFNGLQLPAIASWNGKTGKRRVFREFGYADFMSRLS